MGFSKVKLKMMGSFSNLLQDEANILQDEMAMQNSATSFNPELKIVTWWMLSFLTRSKAGFEFFQS